MERFEGAERPRLELSAQHRLTDAAWLERACLALDQVSPRADGRFTAGSVLNRDAIHLDLDEFRSVLRSVDPEGELDLEDFPWAAHFPPSRPPRLMPFLFGMIALLFGGSVFFFAPAVELRWVYGLGGLLGLLLVAWVSHGITRRMRLRAEAGRQGYEFGETYPLTVRGLLAYRRPSFGQEKAPDRDPGLK